MNAFKQKGLTMIELMIVIVVVAILASIAFPSYEEMMRKGRRADAKNQLLEIAALQERFYSDNGAYGDLTTVAGSDPVPSDEGHYSVTQALGGGGRPQTYTLTATAAVADPNCGNYTYNQAGIVTESGSKDLNYCW